MAFWAEEDGSVRGFMCRVDWEHEIKGAMDGTKVYPSIEDLREHCPCGVEDFGIVEVAVTLVRVVEPGTLWRTLPGH